MNKPTEIIVYRNPGEAALWDWVMNGSGGNVIVWLACAVLVFFAYAIFEREFNRIHKFWTVAFFLVMPTVVYKIVIYILTYL